MNISIKSKKEISRGKMWGDLVRKSLDGEISREDALELTANMVGSPEEPIIINNGENDYSSLIPCLEGNINPNDLDPFLDFLDGM